MQSAPIPAFTPGIVDLGYQHILLFLLWFILGAYQRTVSHTKISHTNISCIVDDISTNSFLRELLYDVHIQYHSCLICISLQPTVADSSLYQVLKTRAPAQFYHGKHYNDIICLIEWQMFCCVMYKRMLFLHPRPPLADHITEDFRERIPFSVFTTNPCRYNYGSLQVSFEYTQIRNHVTGYFGRHQTPVA